MIVFIAEKRSDFKSRFVHSLFWTPVDLTFLISLVSSFPHFPIPKPWFAGLLLASPCCIMNSSASGGLGGGDRFWWQQSNSHLWSSAFVSLPFITVSCRKLKLLLLWGEIIVLEKGFLESVAIFFWSTSLLLMAFLNYLNGICDRNDMPRFCPQPLNIRILLWESWLNCLTVSGMLKSCCCRCSCW